MAELTKADKEQIKRIQEGLKCGYDEALEVLQYDKAVDHSKSKEKLVHDLTDEQEKAAKKLAKCVDRKKPNYQFTQRERKANPTKGGIIAELAKFLENDSEFATENVSITNKERMIAFSIGSDSFEITLIQKRKPKN